MFTLNRMHPFLNNPHNIMNLSPWKKSKLFTRNISTKYLLDTDRDNLANNFINEIAQRDWPKIFKIFREINLRNKGNKSRIETAGILPHFQESPITLNKSRPKTSKRALYTSKSIPSRPELLSFLLKDKTD